MILRGDRCQCAACDEYFNSTFAFDKHRIGKHGESRRCMDVNTMLEKGMSKNKGGFWITAAMRSDNPKAAERLDS